MALSFLLMVTVFLLSFIIMLTQAIALRFLQRGGVSTILISPIHRSLLFTKSIKEKLCSVIFGLKPDMGLNLFKRSMSLIHSPAARISFYIMVIDCFYCESDIGPDVSVS